MGLIVFASDMEVEMARLKSSAEATNTAAKGCTLDPVTSSSWDQWYAGVVEFCGRKVVSIRYPWDPPNVLLASANGSDTIIAYEKELTAWQQRLSAKCPSVPSLSPFGGPSGLPDALTALKYVALAAGFVGVAYTVGKLVPLIPSAKMRAARSRPTAPKLASSPSR